VVRLGAMGDILHALPAVTALRQAHPDWLIDWVVEPRWRALLAAEPFEDSLDSSSQPCQDTNGRSGFQPRQPMLQNERGALAPKLNGKRTPAQPLIDHLHFAPTKFWRKAPLSRQTRDEFLVLRTALRGGEYDAVIDLQGAIRSAIVARLAGCPRVIGESEPRERIARRLFTELVNTHGAHVIEQDIELASAIAGDALKPVKPQLPIDSAAELWSDEILSPTSRQPVVLINPGAGWGAKCWPAERYAAVAQGLIARGCRILINAGPGEEPLAELIVRTTRGAATTLTCSLAQLIALSRRISLAIAGDTGPLHLACALGRPVVGIYGPTDPSRNGPFGTKFIVLRSPQSRRDHTRRQAPEAGLLTIQPGDVLRAAEALLYPESVTESVQ